MLGLKLVAHIVLLLLIAGEDTDLPQVRVKEMLQNGRTERTGTTGNHKGCVIKCRHLNTSSPLVFVNNFNIERTNVSFWHADNQENPKMRIKISI